MCGKLWRSWRRDWNCIYKEAKVAGIERGFLALRSMFEAYNPVCNESGQSSEIQFLTYVLLQAAFDDAHGPLGGR